MNQPGSAEGNWRWRCTDGMLSASVPSQCDLTRPLTDQASRMPRTDASMAAAS